MVTFHSMLLITSSIPGRWNNPFTKIILFLALAFQANAFQPTAVTQSSLPCSLSCPWVHDRIFLYTESALFATSRKAVSKSKTKKNSSAKPGKIKNGKNKKPKNKRSPKASAAGSSLEGKQKKKSSSRPPWQVLGSKEAKENLDREIERRSKIKQGERPSHEEPDMNIAATKPKLSRTFLSDTTQRFLSWKRFSPEKAIADKKFIGAYLDSRQLPPSLGVPEVAFLGRSNVGKSSLLNRLSKSASGGDVARVGKTPGATASVNLYVLLDNKGKELLGWVDLPGFGYAKLSKDTKESVQAAAENYLGNRKELALGILLVDIRRKDPSEDDRAVLAALYDLGVPIMVVATKTDKISSEAERERCLQSIQKGLGLPEGQPLSVSSVSGDGCRSLWQIILEGCEVAVAEAKVKYEGSDDIDEELLLSSSESPSYFQDTDEISYDQGYDWVQDGSSVLYEDDEDYEYFEDEEFAFDEEDSDSSFDIGEPSQKETLKSLKRRVKEMERRGEL